MANPRIRMVSARPGKEHEWTFPKNSEAGESPDPS
jgi:hypothetical protein